MRRERGVRERRGGEERTVKKPTRTGRVAGLRRLLVLLRVLPRLNPIRGLGRVILLHRAAGKS